MNTHIPVMKEEIAESFRYLAAKSRPVFVDGTLGLAGHSLALAKEWKAESGTRLPDGQEWKIIGIDKDQKALSIAREKIDAEKLNNNFTLVNDDFKNINSILKELEISSIDGALLDLGVSSLQLDDPARGFSFRDPEAPLDMRMDQNTKYSAKDVINGYGEQKLFTLLKEYGEERYARSIAKNITLARKIKPIQTAGELTAVISRSVPPSYRFDRRIHFATRTFQAIRIEVNNELSSLDKAIADYVALLKPESKLAIISFHSLEDRIVKNTFRKLENPCQCPIEMPCVCDKKPVVKILTKKPFIPTIQEAAENPRSHSAKLRVVEKI